MYRRGKDTGHPTRRSWRDTNDLDGAVRQLAATPEYIYVLGFSPEALKADGSFHSLTVKLASGHKLDVQARKGYWAPDAKELAGHERPGWSGAPARRHARVHLCSGLLAGGVEGGWQLPFADREAHNPAQARALYAKIIVR